MSLFTLQEDKKKQIKIAVPGEASTGAESTYIESSTKVPKGQKNRQVIADNPAEIKNKSQLIDVVSNYDWTVSPKNNIVEHPYILLDEYRIDRTPLLAELKYLLDTSIENWSAVVKGMFSLQSVLSKLVGDIENVSEKFIDKLNELVNPEDLLASEYLKPYTGLYFLKATGFKYKIPFFTNNMVSKDARWTSQYPGDSTQFTNLIQQGEDLIASYGSGMPLFGLLAEPGIYIERSKYFDPAPGVDPITFSFPLLNTISEDSIQRNFDLLWLLCFQTSSIRRNKTDVFPPCIYRALVPGVRFMLYCSINNISIKHLGVRRRVRIVHPATRQAVETIIPEAYEVTLTINSLTTDSGNFMLEARRDSL